MTTEMLTFVLAFLIAMLWYRILFFAIPTYFKRPFTRSLLKLRWHHLHWGLLLILTGTVLLLLTDKNSVVIILLGAGLGFAMDLFIPSLLLETDREKELEIYKKSLVPTLALFTAIALLLFIVTKLT